MRKRMRRAVCRVAAALALSLLLGGDAALPPRQELCLPETGAVQRRLRALTADVPDGWRYSLRLLPGPDGTTLAADAVRRDALGAWETVHTLWRPENGAWRMVRQTRRKQCPPPGEAEGRE